MQVENNEEPNEIKWFQQEPECIDASEFVDNCQEILTKLNAIELLQQNQITIEEFLKRTKN
jgi:hypothetical protein